MTLTEFEKFVHVANRQRLKAELVARGKLSALVNGYGSQESGLRVVNRFIPGFIKKLFSDEAEDHDLDYIIGGTPEHEDLADDNFTARCFARVRRLYWPFNTILTAWVVGADDLLAVFGRFSFVKREAPCYDADTLLREVGQ